MKNPNNFYVASKSKRFTNFVIDVILLYPFAMFIGFFIGIFDPYFFDYMSETDMNLTGYLIFVIYYSFFEITFGKTIGKMITGTKIIDVSGLKPTTGAIIGRSFCRIIPFEAFSFLGSSGIGWHDSFSGTLVVENDFEKVDIENELTF